MSFPGRRLPWLIAALSLAVCLVAAAVVAVVTSAGTSRRGPAAAPLAASMSPSVSPSVSASVPPSGLDRPPDDEPGPVILIPGYGGGTAMLDGLAKRLRAGGRTAMILALPGNATGDFREQEKVLATQVQHKLRQGAASVDLIGYSAGGIVAALYVESDPSHVRRVVTLGSPLHGTELAKLAAGLAPSACPAACQQMVPGSSLLSTLDDASPTITKVPWLALWSSHDDVVTPPDSARFDGARNIELQSICADDAATHLELPDDPVADGLIAQALSQSWPPPSASAADCVSLRALGH